MVRCKTCGGTYDPLLSDNTEYFHTCPPLSARELRAAIAAQQVRLSRADAARLKQARDADTAAPLPAGEPSREDTILASIIIERPDRRDENVLPNSDTRARGRQIKAEGLGVEPVAP